MIPISAEAPTRGLRPFRDRAPDPRYGSSMSLVETASPATAYLTKPNIVHPDSNRGAAGDARVAADLADGRAELAQRRGLSTVTGGSIQKGR